MNIEFVERVTRNIDLMEKYSCLEDHRIEIFVEEKDGLERSCIVFPVKARKSVYIQDGRIELIIETQKENVYPN